MNHPITTDAIRREIAPLRALAKSLVRDENDADDLVQHAWLQALRNGPDQRGRLAAWLAKVVRNFHVQVLREDARRRRREHATARPEVETTAFDRFEIVQRLVDAVEQLPEPYRSTILLRYFEERTTCEVARLQNVPEATVRTRLRRALARLRERLERDSDGSSDWYAALLPFAFPKPAATSAVALTTGAVGMTTAKKLGLAAIVLFAISLLYTTSVVQSFGEPDAVPPTPLVSPGPARDTGPSPTPERDPVAQSRTVVDTASTRASGRVVDDRFRALRGVPVVVEVLGGIAEDDRLERRLRATTDDNGEFEVSWPTPEANARIRFRAGGNRYWFRDRSLIVRRGETEIPAVTLDALVLDSVVYGRVTDTAGRAIAGAELRSARLLECVARCDADGNFELRVASRREHPIWAKADTFGLEARSVDVGEPGARVRLDFELKPGWRIAGKVVARDGRPIAGAVVRAFHSFWQTTESDVEGRFELAHFPRTQKRQVLWFRHPEFLDRHIEVPIDGGAELLVRMEPGQPVAGTVFGPEGRPVNAAELYARPDGMLNKQPDAVTGPDGRFRIPSTDADWNKLRVRAPGLALTVVDVEPGKGGELVVRMREAVRLDGIIVDGDGTPVPHVEIELTLGTPVAFEVWNRLGRVARSDAAGRFEVTGIGDEVVTLELVRRGYVTREVELRAAGTHRITMDRKAGLAGRVLDGASGQPIEDFTVKLFRPSHVPDDVAVTEWSPDWSQGRAFRAASGEWTTKGEAFAPGRVVGVEVRARGFAPLVHERAETATEPQPLIARLVRGGVVAGRVLADGPIADARVVLLASNRPLESTTSNTALFGHPGTKTDEQGRFRFDDVPEGPASLVVELSGYAVAVRRGIEVHRGRITTTPDIELGVGSELEIAWTDAGGRTQAAVPIRLEAVSVPAEHGRSWLAHTDPEGRVRFPSLNPGTYRVLRLAPGTTVYYVGFAKTVTVTDQAQQEVAVTEKLGTSAVTGSVVTTRHRRDELTVRVKLEGRPGLAWGAFVDHGRFRIDGLPEGTYTLEARRARGLGSYTGARVGPKLRVVVTGTRDVVVRLD